MGMMSFTTLAEDQTSSLYSVLFNAEAIPEDFAGQVEAAGGVVLYTVPEIGFAQVQLPDSAIGTIKGLSSVMVMNPAIAWELPESTKITVDADTVAAATEDAFFWPIQWDIQRITQDGAAYEYGTGSHDTVVGIIDTGIDPDHRDLVMNLLPGSKNFVPGPDGTVDINDIQDMRGHGTHVAGSIAANGAMLGVAPDIGFRAYKVFGQEKGAKSAWILSAMIAAADDGVDVINMSLGGFDSIGNIFWTDPETGKTEKVGSDIADFKAYRRAMKYVTDRNVVVVVAAGNDAIDSSNRKQVSEFMNSEYGQYGYDFRGATVNVPADLPGVITVSATGPEDELAVYSNYGSGFIQITTPGGNYDLRLEYIDQGRDEEYLANQLYRTEFCLSTGEDGTWYYSVGTSMAAPKVAAAAALAIDKYGQMPNHKVAEMLEKSADKVKGTDKKYFGAGHLNTLNLLQD